MNDRTSQDAARWLEIEIKHFVSNSPINRIPDNGQQVIFDEPLIGYSAGDDQLFIEYKSVIAHTHLTPREALAFSLDKTPEDLPQKLSVISWVLPVTSKTRQSNRQEKITPSLMWAYTRWYGEKFNDALRAYVVRMLSERGYLAVAPAIQPYFRQDRNEKGPYSNWSERHVAYVAGLGTFSLSDGFITKRGIAHRVGSVVTDLELPPGLRTARTAFSNCLFYADGSCRACIARCPAGAITEAGHNKVKCSEYMRNEPFNHLRQDWQVGITGCGLCQVKVPCEFKNPTAKVKK